MMTLADCHGKRWLAAQPPATSYVCYEYLVIAIRHMAGEAICIFNQITTYKINHFAYKIPANRCININIYKILNVTIITSNNSLFLQKSKKHGDKE